MTNTIEAAKGRWREILAALGVPAECLNGRPQPCPMCGGTDRFTFDDRNGDGDFICRRCDAGKGLQFLMRFHDWDFAKAAREVDAVIGNLPKEKPKSVQERRTVSDVELNRVWSSSKQITPDSPVGLYLQKRGLDIGPWQRCLRETIATFHPHQHVFPVLVAKFCDRDGNGKQIHQTFLTEQGEKAAIDPCRRFMRGPLPKGGAVRIGEVVETMGIAEGIETALSAAKLFKFPVWAATNAAMLRLWEPPVGVRRVVVFGDNDKNYVGQQAAYVLAERLSAEAERKDKSLTIEVRIPETTGNDWNDELMEHNYARTTH